MTAELIWADELAAAERLAYENRIAGLTDRLTMVRDMCRTAIHDEAELASVLASDLLDALDLPRPRLRRTR